MKKTAALPWQSFGIWIPVAVFLAAFALVRHYVLSALDRQQQLQAALLDQRRTLSKIAESRANEVLQDYRRKNAADPPMAYAEEALNAGKPLPVDYRSMIWTDAQGGQASLEMESGHWISTKPLARYNASPTLAYANVARILNIATSFALTACIGMWCFLAFITACTSVPFHQRPKKIIIKLTVHLLLLAIVTLVLAILDSPNDWYLSIRDLSPNLLAGPTFIIISIVAFIINARRRHNHPRCLKCGYNLTKNTSGTCPECGKMVIEAF